MITLSPKKMILSPNKLLQFYLNTYRHMLMHTYTKTMNILFLAKALLISAIWHTLSYLYEIEEFKFFFFESFRIGVSDGAFQSVNLYTISLSKGVYFVGCIWIKQLSQPVQLVLITATGSQTTIMVAARPYVCWVLLFLFMFHCLSVSTILATFF